MKRNIVAIAALLSLCGLAGEIVVDGKSMTIQGAIEKIAQEKAKGNKEAWKVLVKKGYHKIDKTLMITPSISGEDKARVVFQGENGAVIGAGDRLVDWKDEGNGVWSIPAPRDKDGKMIWFEELWINSRRAQMARWPKGEEWRSKTYSITPITNGVSKTRRFRECATFTNAAFKTIAKIPKDEYDYTKVGMYNKWKFHIRILKDVDIEKDAVITETRFAFSPSSGTTEYFYFFQNVRFAFTDPGEWFYDAKNKKIMYRPLPGEDMKKSSVYAPLAKVTKLIEIKGNPQKKEYVKNIDFVNLSFEHTDMDPVALDGKPREKMGCQASTITDAAINLTGVKSVNFDNCSFRHTGNHCIRLNEGCTSCKISNCLMEDLGAGGIWIGPMKSYVADGEKLTRSQIKKLSPLSTAFITVENCTIRDGGNVYPEGIGVVIATASDCKVMHCDIHDFYYSGVSVGWTWGYKGSVAQRNEVAYNKIYNLGKRVMADMGGVYTLGTSFGTKVHHNLIHDVYSRTYGGWGLYTDEGSEGIDMYNNLVYNTHDGGFHQHYGVDNIIRNNIFIWNESIGSIRSARKLGLGNVPSTMHIVQNIVVNNHEQLSSWGADGIRGIWAGNLWWTTPGVKPIWGKEMDWEKWKKTGREICSEYADPQFVSLENGDFRLKKTSPAFKLGFKEFDLTGVGRQVKCTCSRKSASSDFVNEARKVYATKEYSSYVNTIVHKYMCPGYHDKDEAGLVKWINVDGARNVRDVGGWNGLKTGKVYRGSELNAVGKHWLGITPMGVAKLRDLGIKSDLDLRAENKKERGECLNVSAIGKDVKLYSAPVSGYMELYSKKGKENFAKVLRVFTKDENYPVYIHCWGGADRTAAVVFLLQGLCGVNEVDLSIEYELTSFANFGGRTRVNRGAFFRYADMIAEMKTYPGKTLQEKFASYFKKELKFSDAEISAIRKNLMNKNENLIVYEK